MIKNIVRIHKKDGSVITVERRLLGSYIKVNGSESIVNIDYGFSMSEKEYSDMKRECDQVFDRMFGDLFRSFDDLNRR